ncbi:MAG TPA: glycosyl hydrolase [Chloroflexota bacterium]|nr:glycosyl hydrolase [Chloroflexota bacterium]
MAILISISLFLIVSPGAAAASTPYSSNAASLPIPQSGAYLGVSVAQDTSEELLDNLRQYQFDAGKNAALVMYWRDFAASGQVDVRVMDAIYAQGSVPVISWGPGCWSGCDPSVNYSLNAVASGSFDSYIRSFADSLRSYNQPVLLRFDAEMNNGCNGCDASAFVAAWRHIHDIFEQEGATNVEWVWCPDVDWDGQHPFAAYYPGSAYVDWLGLDGYNRPYIGYEWFSRIFSASLRELQAIDPSAPVMIGETASSEATADEAAAGKTKAAWIADAYGTGIPSFPRIKAVVWFNQDTSAQDGCSCNWMIESSPAATQAYAVAVASSYFLASPVQAVEAAQQVANPTFTTGRDAGSASVASSPSAAQPALPLPPPTGTAPTQYRPR